MAGITRTANAHWQGTGKEGKGTLTTQSGVLSTTPYGFNTRFGDTKGTNPEELLAASHAGCFSMALAFALTAAGFTPDEHRHHRPRDAGAGRPRLQDLAIRADAGGERARHRPASSSRRSPRAPRPAVRSPRSSTRRSRWTGSSSERTSSRRTRLQIDLSGKTGIVTGSTSASARRSRRVSRPPAPASSINGRKQATVDGGRAGHRDGRAGRQGARRSGRCRHRGRLRRADRCGAGGRHPGQQRRHLRAQAVLRYPGCRLDALLRDQRHVRRAAVARLHAGHARAQLGAHRLHLIGIGAQHPQGDDPLRLLQDRPARRLARSRRADRRHRRDRQLRPAGADALGGRGGVPAGHGEADRRIGRGRWRRASSRSIARPPSSSASPASRRSPTWCSTPYRRRPPPPTARRCASTAAW